MAGTTQPTDEERAAARHYLVRFEVDTLRSRPLWIRLIGACLAVIIIGLVRGLPGRPEQAAAEGGELPMQDEAD